MLAEHTHTRPDWNAISDYCEEVAEMAKGMSGRLSEEPELNRGGLNEISYLLWRLHEAASAKAAQMHAKGDTSRPVLSSQRSRCEADGEMILSVDTEAETMGRRRAKRHDNRSPDPSIAQTAPLESQ